MSQNKYFDISRFLMLLKLELFRSTKALSIIVGITFGALFFMGMLLSLAVEKHIVVFNHEESYAFTLIVGGFVVSSLAFSDLGNSLRRQNFLSLPVSALERFLVMWLLTTVGWVVLYTLEFTVYSFLANPIGHMIFRKVQFLPFDPLGDFALTVMKYYFVTQGIFLAGAVFFKGYVFPKTVVTLVIFACICGLMIYFGLKEEFLSDHYCNVQTGECELVDAAVAHVIWDILKFSFWWVLAPLTWVTTYLGLKELEV